MFAALIAFFAWVESPFIMYPKVSLLSVGELRIIVCEVDILLPLMRIGYVFPNSEETKLIALS